MLTAEDDCLRGLVRRAAGYCSKSKSKSLQELSRACQALLCSTNRLTLLTSIFELWLHYTFIKINSKRSLRWLSRFFFLLLPSSVLVHGGTCTMKSFPPRSYSVLPFMSRILSTKRRPVQMRPQINFLSLKCLAVLRRSTSWGSYHHSPSWQSLWTSSSPRPIRAIS